MSLKQDDHALEHQAEKYFGIGKKSTATPPTANTAPKMDPALGAKIAKFINFVSLGKTHVSANQVLSFHNKMANIPSEALRENILVAPFTGADGQSHTLGAGNFGNAREKASTDPFKLTPAEVYTLQSYTGSDYGAVNAALRSGKPLAGFSTYVETLNSGLAKLPDYNGPVNRGATLPPAVLAQHQVGDVVNYPAYTSTSKATGFGGNHHFHIFSKHGKYVRTYSNYAEEDEVLFAPNAKFKVLDRNEHPDGTIDFTMVEVD